jgi:hypothetical protein
MRQNIILRDHFEEAPKRVAAFGSHPGLTTAEVLEPAHLEEFAADQYSSALLFEGERRGGLTTAGADRIQAWRALERQLWGSGLGVQHFWSRGANVGAVGDQALRQTSTRVRTLGQDCRGSATAFADS